MMCSLEGDFAESRSCPECFGNDSWLLCRNQKYNPCRIGTM